MVYSLINMRQLHILFNSAKTWLVIVCWFLCFAPNLPELNLKLFCSDVQNNFRFSSGKFGGNTEIDKQWHVMFWLNWIKYGAVSYSLSCIINETHFSISLWTESRADQFGNISASVWDYLYPFSWPFLALWRLDFFFFLYSTSSFFFCSSKHRE